jgi:nanoRNase/pAp phosphatase (c-di-AMP/oligoRNAs hydrolase)
MLGFLYPYMAVKKLAKIQNPELPRYHFKTLKRAVDSAMIYDHLLFCDLGEVRNADLIAEIADYMLRIREVRCVYVMGRVDETKAIFSLRYKSTRKSVGHIAMKIVKGIGYGGGHVQTAGGQIPLLSKVYTDISAMMKQRLLKLLHILPETEGKPI